MSTPKANHHSLEGETDKEELKRLKRNAASLKSYYKKTAQREAAAKKQADEERRKQPAFLKEQKRRRQAEYSLKSYHKRKAEKKQQQAEAEAKAEAETERKRRAEMTEEDRRNVKTARFIDEQIAVIYSTKQGPNMTVLQYHTYFKSETAVLETIGGSFWYHAGMHKETIHRLHASGTVSKSVYANLSDNEKETALEAMKEEFLAMRFIMGSDKNRFGRMIADLDDDYAKGVDNYPKSLEDAVVQMQSWLQTHPVRSNNNPPAAAGLEATDSARRTVAPEAAAGEQFLQMAGSPTKQS